MKKLLFILLVSTTLNTFGQVGIGTTTPAPSAQLDVNSTTKGFLPPRMTFAQRNSIVFPAAGLVVWCSDCDELQVYNGTVWKNMTGVAASGPTLPNISICDQSWMVKNLDVTAYRDGSSIPQVTDPDIWANLTIGAWCWYNNDPANNAVYGKLYNWYAVNDARGLAPFGWHIPSDLDWTTLFNCLGGSSVAGGKLKETGTAHWLTPNTGATNVSGFTGLPGGYCSNIGSFDARGAYGFWWTSVAINPSQANAKALDYSSGGTVNNLSSKKLGFSVRCIRD